MMVAIIWIIRHGIQPAFLYAQGTTNIPDPIILFIVKAYPTSQDSVSVLAIWFIYNTK